MAVGPIITLKQDLVGTIESRILPFDFINNIAPNDTLIGSPTIEQNSEIGGSSALLFGTPQISGTRALVRVTGGTLNALYDVSCTVQTASGDTLVGSCGIKIIPSK